MLKNKKGFVIEGVLVIWAIVALAIGTVVVIQGPNLVKAVTGNDRNQSKQTLESSERYTMGRIDDKGNFVKVGDYDKKLKTLNITAEKPKETLWEKFWHLGWMAVIIIGLIAGIITYLGAWGWWNKKMKAIRDKLTVVEVEKAELNTDAKLIVQSVDAGWGVIKRSIELNKQLAASAIDINQKATYQAVTDALTKAIADMKKEMDTIQDTSTYNLVIELMKND